MKTHLIIALLLAAFSASAQVIERLAESFPKTIAQGTFLFDESKWPVLIINNTLVQQVLYSDSALLTLNKLYRTTRRSRSQNVFDVVLEVVCLQSMEQGPGNYGPTPYSARTCNLVSIHSIALARQE
jgi:hypothetical protein